MAISYVGTGAVANNTSASTTLNVAYPASLAANDLLVLFVAVSSATAPTLPAGFTSQASITSGGSSPALRVMTKLATGSESGSLACTTPNVTSHGQMLAYRGVDTTTPVDVAAGTYSNSSASTSYAMSSVTTTVANTVLVGAGAGNQASGSWTPPSSPAAFTELTDNITAIPKFTVAHLVPWTGSGATGTVTFTTGSIRGCAAFIALRPGGSTFSSTADVATTATISASGAMTTQSTGAVATTTTITAAGSKITASTGAGATTATITAAGSYITSSTATEAVTATITAIGGLTVASTATEPITATIAAAGGLLVASTASVPVTTTITASGAKIAASTATVATTTTITASGAKITQSTATEAVAATISASGAKVTQSTATEAITATVTASGTRIASSTAALPVSASITALGGLVGVGASTLDVGLVILADGVVVGAIAPTWTFVTPTTEELYDHELFWVGVAEGISLAIETDGQWKRFRGLPQRLAIAGVEGTTFFRGGRTYSGVTDEVKVALIAAGVVNEGAFT